LKVLVVNPSLFAPYYDFQFCRALVKAGASVTMVGRPLRGYEQRLDHELFSFADLFYRGTSRRETGWHTSTMGRVRKGLEHASGLLRLKWLAAVGHADIINFQWLVVPILDRIALSALSRSSGLVLTVHNAEIATHNRSAVVGRLGSTLQSLGQKGAVLSFDRYVAHTERTVTALNRLGIESSKIIHVPHPPLLLDWNSLPAAENARVGPLNILFFGQIKPYKGLDVLVEAGIALAAIRRDFRITVAGRPFFSIDGLRGRIKDAGAEELFHFDLDYIPDQRLAEYLAASDIVVFPYKEIDGSGALSHAVLFDKPIVASRVGGFAESPFKDFVELVTPNSPSALEATLMQLLDEPSRLEFLRKQTIKLKQLLPTWQEYAQKCLAAFGEISRGRA